MKKAVILLAFVISTSALAAQVDPLWRLQKRDLTPSIGEALGVPPVLGIDVDPLIRVIVKTSDTALTAERIRQSGGKVRSIVGPLITAALPAKVLEGETADWTEAVYIEAAKRMSLLNDLADANTQVTTVQAGTDLPYGYDGTGVIIGIVDTGIDLTQQDFKSASGKTRILYLWDQTDPAGPGPTEIESSYGTEYTQAQIIAGTVPEKDTNGHGTHVAGSAGGRDVSYSGVAPRASFIIVKYDFTNVTTDAVNYIFQKAAALGMPAVVNMSLGSDGGAHDGTSLEEEGLNELVSAVPGRAVVVAAGNSGDEELSDVIQGGYHSRLSVTTGATSRTRFNVYQNEEFLDIDAWGEQDCAVDISVDLLNSGGVVATTGWVANGSILTDLSLAGLATVSIDRTQTNDPQNGKWEAYLSILPSADYLYEDNYLSLNAQGLCPYFDAWSQSSDLFFGDTSGGEWYPGDNRYTVGSPATAVNVVAAGAYTTRTTWTDSSGEVQTPSGVTLDSLSYFSSRGPAIDPESQGIKPNLTAPGAFIISARSADSTPDSSDIIDAEHVVMAGTSMASPHIAGIVALMLQAYPFLTYSEIMEYLQSTATSDPYVGAAPNADWGYGKVDAFAVLRAVVADHPPVDDVNITTPGITAGETNADDAMQKITVNFPRPVDAVTLNSNNLYINTQTPGSPLSSSSAWTPSPCDPAGDTLSSTVALIDPQTAEITLSDVISLGDFTLCLTPDVADTEGETFWGKTVQFGTSLPNTGCSLIRRD